MLLSHAPMPISGLFCNGVGRSGLTRYYKGYNIDYAESSGRFVEAMDVITKAWSEQSFSHEGDFYSFHDVSV